MREFAANFGGVKKKEKKKQFFDLPATLEYLQELWNKANSRVGRVGVTMAFASVLQQLDFRLTIPTLKISVRTVIGLATKEKVRCPLSPIWPNTCFFISRRLA